MQVSNASKRLKTDAIKQGRRVKIFLFASLIALSACTKPMDVESIAAPSTDKNAKFAIKDSPRGFSVTVSYSRYQFVPETDAVISACRSLLIGRAYEEAKTRGRDINQIADQDVRVSTGRNIINARTSCNAFVETMYSH